MKGVFQHLLEKLLIILAIGFTIFCLVHIFSIFLLTLAYN